jgi:phosphatidylglycerol lysyltransferase
MRSVVTGAASAPRAPAPAALPWPHEQLRTRAQLAASYGRTGVAPFIANPDVEVIDLVGGWGAAGFSPVRRWAVTAGDVVAPEGLTEQALSEYLDALRGRRLRPVFVAVSDPAPLQRRGFHVSEIADEAVLDLTGFSLAGSKRANLRHSVTSARRAGLSIAPYSPRYDAQLAEVSAEWLRTKRGGELGFTLSRLDDVAGQLGDHNTDLWVLLDGADRVQAWCTWRHYLGDRGRVVDMMRRRTNAPNPAMDLLLAGTLEHYRDAGVELASLASVPRTHGSAAERIYPTRSLRAYKQKFDPRWEPRWLAVPSAWQQPFALAAVCAAYCPGGMRRALRRND